MLGMRIQYIILQLVIFLMRHIAKSDAIEKQPAIPAHDNNFQLWLRRLFFTKAATIKSAESEITTEIDEIVPLTEASAPEMVGVDVVVWLS